MNNTQTSTKKIVFAFIFTFLAFGFAGISTTAAFTLIFWAGGLIGYKLAKDDYENATD